MGAGAASGIVVDDPDIDRTKASLDVRRLAFELDRGTGAPIAQEVARGESGYIDSEPLSLFCPDEAVLLRGVEPKHQATQVRISSLGSLSPSSRRLLPGLLLPFLLLDRFISRRRLLPVVAGLSDRRVRVPAHGCSRTSRGGRA